MQKTSIRPAVAVMYLLSSRCTQLIIMLVTAATLVYAVPTEHVHGSLAMPTPCGAGLARRSVAFASSELGARNMSKPDADLFRIADSLKLLA